MMLAWISKESKAKNPRLLHAFGMHLRDTVHSSHLVPVGAATIRKTWQHAGLENSSHGVRTRARHAGCKQLEEDHTQ